MQDITLSFTIQDIFWLCGGLGAIIALFKVIGSLNPIKVIRKHLDNDNKRINDHEERLKELEEVNTGQSYLILKSLQALMRNAQTGNNKKQLDEVSTELNDYLLKK
ncbi:MAG: hypothetical protein RR565_09615 [Erysipelothrix sp.]